MKRIILIITSSIIFSAVTAQITFNNRYIIDQAAIIFQNIVQTEDTIITMGLGSTFYAPFPGKLMFTKFDQDGELLSYDLILADSFTHYFPLASSIKDRKVLAVGGAGGSIPNQSGFYALYDLDSGLDWIKQYYPPTGWTMFFESCLFIEDKIYILTNMQNHNAGSIISTKLLCSDTLGNILWEIPFQDGFNNIVPGIINFNQDSTSIYLGVSRSDIPFIQFESDLKSVIYQLDLDGNILSEWENDENNTHRPEQFIEMDDNSLVFVGRHLAGYSSGNIPLSQGYISKVDSLSNRAWSFKTGKTTALTKMNNFIATKDDNFIAIGVTADSLSSSQVLTHSGHIVKFNIDGEMIWERRHFGVESVQEFNRPFDIVELPDSSLLICGESVDTFDDFPNRGWLLKLDKYGCLVPDCHLTVSTSDLSNITIHANIYPNPTSDYLNIFISNPLKNGRADIINLSGQVIKTFNLTGGEATYIYNVSHLTAGIYFLKIQDEEGRILTKEFVVQR